MSVGLKTLGFAFQIVQLCLLVKSLPPYQAWEETAQEGGRERGRGWEEEILSSGVGGLLVIGIGH